MREGGCRGRCRLQKGQSLAVQAGMSVLIVNEEAVLSAAVVALPPPPALRPSLSRLSSTVQTTSATTSAAPLVQTAAIESCSWS